MLWGTQESRAADAAILETDLAGPISTQQGLLLIKRIGLFGPVVAQDQNGTVHASGIGNRFRAL